MAFKTVSKTGVRSAARRPLSPRLNLTPHIPKESSIHTDVGFAGRSKLRRIGDVMQSCRERLSSRQRRIAKRQPRRLVHMVRKEGFHATTLPDLHLEL
jgi:hypothetical protein